jgi:hypothetical protein
VDVGEQVATKAHASTLAVSGATVQRTGAVATKAESESRCGDDTEVSAGAEILVMVRGTVTASIRDGQIILHEVHGEVSRVRAGAAD